MKTVLSVIALLMVALVMGCKPTADGGDNSGGSNTETETPESVVYTVAFDGNGGEVKSFNEAGELVVVSNIEVEPGTTLSSLPLSLLDNYAFLGWHDSKGIEFTRDTVVTKDITVTATLEVATDGLAYVNNGDGTASVGNNQSFAGTDVIIASAYNGLPVTEIEANAFSGEVLNENTVLKNVVIPDTIKTIGNAAFHWCTSLKSIKIGNGVETIESMAFSSSGLTSVVIPNSVITIEGNAFYNCWYLTDVIIGKGVKTIQIGAFSSTNLRSITFTDSIETIGWSIFSSSKENLSTYFLESEESHIGWYNDWNRDQRPVVWGCTLNDGANEAPYVVSVEKTESTIENADETKTLNAPYREGYTFAGWTRTENGSTVDVDLTTADTLRTVVTNGERVYAVWSAN